MDLKSVGACCIEVGVAHTAPTVHDGQPTAFSRVIRKMTNRERGVVREDCAAPCQNGVRAFAKSVSEAEGFRRGEGRLPGRRQHRALEIDRGFEGDPGPSRADPKAEAS